MVVAAALAVAAADRARFHAWARASKGLVKRPHRSRERGGADSSAFPLSVPDPKCPSHPPHAVARQPCPTSAPMNRVGHPHASRMVACAVDGIEGASGRDPKRSFKGLFPASCGHPCHYNLRTRDRLPVTPAISTFVGSTRCRSGYPALFQIRRYPRPRHRASSARPHQRSGLRLPRLSKATRNIVLEEG
jgi:hypothetical protein